ncbi:unnamed protein product [Cuscuta campestris]|uniref:Uncharacterized protein n=1 Tax=Cuscuta campestris TaxID=132261 RepID=A0A484K7K8_9ASTE|nr:unnamed protein product [Cuscuta campestris]
MGRGGFSSGGKGRGGGSRPACRSKASRDAEGKGKGVDSTLITSPHFGFIPLIRLSFCGLRKVFVDAPGYLTFCSQRKILMAISLNGRSLDWVEEHKGKRQEEGMIVRKPTTCSPTERQMSSWLHQLDPLTICED